jgi:hypothetical protein
VTHVELVPFEDPPPDEGEPIELRVLNPSYEKELAEYRAALERNPFAETHVSEMRPARLVDTPEALVGANEICIQHQSVTLIVGYPFAGQYAATIHPSTPAGFTRADLFQQLVRIYTAMYDGATFSSVERLHNRRVDSPRYGTAWHVLDDLAIEEVLLEIRADGRVLAWIAIGS